MNDFLYIFSVPDELLKSVIVSILSKKPAVYRTLMIRQICVAHLLTHSAQNDTFAGELMYV